MHKPIFLRLTVAALLLITLTPTAFSEDLTPDCTHTDSWPSAITYSYLRNQKILDVSRFNGWKTQVTRLASEKTGKDEYRQLHLVEFYGKDGEPLTKSIINSMVSTEECSGDIIDIYLIEKKLDIPSIQ